MSLSHQAQRMWLLLMCFYGGGKVGEVRAGVQRKRVVEAGGDAAG